MSDGRERPVSLLRAVDPVRDALEHAHGWFRREQDPAGFWVGELESNPTVEAEYLLLMHFLGVEEDDRRRRIVQEILRRQREDGTWGLYFGAPGDLSTTVECYFALKLAGIPACDPAMVKARAFILRGGGVKRTRTFTRIWLALFGQWDWRGLPAMPPELMLLPDAAPLSIYRFASWARATIVPMLLILTDRPVCPVPPCATLDELFLRPEDHEPLAAPRLLESRDWTWVFRALDRALHGYDRGVAFRALRRSARDKAERWILAHQEADGSWGGIQAPWVYSLMALKQLGYPLEHPVMRRGIEGFRGRWSQEQPEGGLRIQACLSPVWDTCLALLALLDSGVPPDDELVRRGARWLIAKEARSPGDWAVRLKGVVPSGWAFEFENDAYPDVDDTAVVLMVLQRARMATAPEESARLGAVHRGVAWTLAMQCANGGWAAFDKDNVMRLPAMLPFCDYGDVLDPPSADVTAHVLEMLGWSGFTRDHPAVRRGLAFLRAHQEPDGSWFGRWGVNHVYGVGAALPALEALHEDPQGLDVRLAVGWLAAHQNLDGGWGETCASYVDDRLRGVGESTASQTSWALLALVAAREIDHPATRRGVAWLVDRQQADGTWDEPQFTGCGFPGYGFGDRPDRFARQGEKDGQGSALSSCFMIKYHLYRAYFPLLALGRYRAALQGLQSTK